MLTRALENETEIRSSMIADKFGENGDPSKQVDGCARVVVRKLVDRANCDSNGLEAWRPIDSTQAKFNSGQFLIFSDFDDKNGLFRHGLQHSDKQRVFGVGHKMGFRGWAAQNPAPLFLPPLLPPAPNFYHFLSLADFSLSCRPRSRPRLSLGSL